MRSHLASRLFNASLRSQQPADIAAETQMKITPVHSRENKPEYRMPFVPAFMVEGAKLVFVAGCGPIPPYHKHPHVPEEEAEWFKGGIREQTLKTFEHIKMVLAAAGADLTNIV